MHKTGINGWTALWLLGCVGLVLILVQELRQGPPRPGAAGVGVVDAAASRLPAVPEETFGLPPLEELDGVLARPLFSATRRPPVAPEPKPQTVPKPPVSATSRMAPKLSLVGVVITPGQRSALLWDDSRRGFVRATQGMQVAGWELAEVARDHVILSQGKRRHELELRTDKGAGGGR